MMDVAPCGCLAAKFDSCNNLPSSVHTLLVNILRCVRLYIKRKYYIINPGVEIQNVSLDFLNNISAFGLFIILAARPAKRCHTYLYIRLKMPNSIDFSIYVFWCVISY